jgi:hypothetical protein
MLDFVNEHPTVCYCDSEFAYDAEKRKLYRLDKNKNLLDLKTGAETGQHLMPSPSANTPGFEIQTK